MKMKCIKRLMVDELDDFEGKPTGEDFVVEVGEVWDKEESNLMLTDGGGSWLDIDESTIEEYFEEV